MLLKQASWNKEGLNEKIFNVIFEKMPQLRERYGPYEIMRTKEDIDYHLSFLSQAVSLKNLDLFIDYILWTRIVLESRNVPTSVLKITLEAMKQVLVKEFEDETQGLIRNFLDSALDSLKKPLPEEHTYLEQSKQRYLAEKYLELLLANKRKESIEFIKDLAENNLEYEDIYLEILQPVQREIGRLWQTNKISVAQEHYSTAVTQMAIAQLYPYIFNVKRKGKTLVATCIGGELHEMAIRMVADFFEMDGWDTYYLGANTPSESIIKAIEQQDADLLAISATMMINLEPLSKLIELIREKVGNKINIIAGGYPFEIDKELWKKIGADGYASNGKSAVKLANSLVM